MKLRAINTVHVLLAPAPAAVSVIEAGTVFEVTSAEFETGKLQELLDREALVEFVEPKPILAAKPSASVAKP